MELVKISLIGNSIGEEDNNTHRHIPLYYEASIDPLHGLASRFHGHQSLLVDIGRFEHAESLL
jgi:hypothetical protein